MWVLIFLFFFIKLKRRPRKLVFATPLDTAIFTKNSCPVGQKRLTFDSQTPDGGKVPPTKHKKNAQVTHFGDMRPANFSLGIKSPKKGKDTPKKSKKKFLGTPLRVYGTATSTTSATSLVFLGEIEEPGVH